MKSHTPHNREAGFTLIELSIVLVIIGLIAGGILVGQDMIKAAAIKNVIKQMDQYNAAINTFRDKYSAMPGDVTPAKITQFNLPDSGGARVGAAGAAGKGDGDGLLSACGASVVGFGCETTWIWNDLAFASLIPDNLNTNAPTVALTALTVTTAPTYVPKTKLRDTALISTYSYNGRNFFLIGNMLASTTAPNYTTTAGLTVREANDIDTKLDDGAPTTGVITSQISGAVTGAASPGPTAAAATACNWGATAPVSAYNTGTSGNYLENVNCLLGVRMQ